MASPIALVGISYVFGGAGATSFGLILGPGGGTDFGDGNIVSCYGDSIASHGPAPHNAAVIVTASSDNFLNGLGVTRVGDQASCGCFVQIGSPDTFSD